MYGSHLNRGFVFGAKGTENLIKAPLFEAKGIRIIIPCVFLNVETKGTENLIKA